MNTFRKPIWLLLSITFPQTILLLLWISSYKIIHTLLSDDNIQYWIDYGLALIIPYILLSGLSIYLIRRKKDIPVIVIFPVIAYYVAFLFVFLKDCNQLVPFSIPSWMFFDGDLILFTFSLIMPIIACAIFMLISYFSPREENYAKISVNLLIAISIPLLCYILIRILDNKFGFADFFFVIFITGTILFFFFLLRFIYLLVLKKGSLGVQSRIIMNLIFALCLPILGLLVNQGNFKSYDFTGSKGGIFGDFSSAWFYILTVINYIFLSLPSSKNLAINKITFFLRSITFIFTVYFFIIFLPYLPISILAIISFGLGFLMLTPIILMVLHTSILHEQFHELKTLNEKPLKLFLSGFIVIPMILFISFSYDKYTLTKAMNYAFNQTDKCEISISSKSIKSALSHIKANKSNMRNEIFEDGERTPYLSFFYNWMVLENLTLSDDKINTLSRIYLGSDKDAEKKQHNSNLFNANNVISSAKCAQINSTTKYEGNHYVSEAEVIISNTNFELFNNEYIGSFRLPTGCYISDFYLDIDGKKEKGILAEKKTASWIFNQIVHTRKDPAILTYSDMNMLNLRVFPVEKNESRKVYITIIHDNPFALQIDSVIHNLGDASLKLQTGSTKISESNAVVFIPSDYKLTLPLEKRKTYLHLFIDYSTNTKYTFNEIEELLQDLAEESKSAVQDAKITLVNYNCKTYTYRKYKEEKPEMKHQGGFFLERALDTELKENYFKHSNLFPIIIAVTNDIDNPIYTKTNNAFDIYCPEVQEFYLANTGSYGIFAEKHLSNNMFFRLTNQIDTTTHSVRVYKMRNQNYYLQDNSEANYILKTEKFEFDTTITDKYQIAHELLAGTLTDFSDKNWIDNIKYSFKTGILTPNTSYISVENQAQKDALYAKQKRVLNADKNLDLEEKEVEVSQSMSEPDWYFFAIIIGMFSYYFYRKEKNSVTVKIHDKAK